MPNYIKLNTNDSHLSLGNLFREIKKISVNKTSAIQSEIFCTLFSIDSISDTTVGNYCTGYRAIGSPYKQIYLTYKKQFTTNKNILIPTINNLISIMDGYVYDHKTIVELNQFSSLQKLCQNMHSYVKNDLSVPPAFKKDLLSFLTHKKYYTFLCHLLFFVVLEKKQPVYEEDLVGETIEEILSKTNLSLNDLKRYLQIEFQEGISFIPSLQKLAKENNPYALFQLGNLEYSGEIAGVPRYEKAFAYHQRAASFQHPTAYWMLAHMILQGKIGSHSDSDIALAHEYLDKAISLKSISALNTKGLCFLNGWNQEKKVDLVQAEKYFLKAAKENYLYAFNNLGRIYEMQNHPQKALEMFLKSANEEESWACNKVGLYYFHGTGVKKDDALAFHYFNLGANTPIKNRNNWNLYHLVELFYLKGNSTLGIAKNEEYALQLLEEIKNWEPVNELFLSIYYAKFCQSHSAENLQKVNEYLNLVNNSINKEKKKQIEKNLKKIKESQIIL